MSSLFSALPQPPFGKPQHLQQKVLTLLTPADLLGTSCRGERHCFIDRNETNSFISAVVIFNHLLLETLLWGAKPDVLCCGSSPSLPALHPPLGTAPRLR